MLGLDRGGSCKGLVSDRRGRHRRRDGDHLWREMLAGSYIPTQCKAETDTGQVWAISFVMDRENERDEDLTKNSSMFLPQQRADRHLRRIPLHTVEHLDAMGLKDQQLSRVAERVRRQWLRLSPQISEIETAFSQRDVGGNDRLAQFALPFMNMAQCADVMQPTKTASTSSPGQDP